MGTDTPDLLRIVAVRAPWPTPAEQPSRQGLKLRWNTFLVADGAPILVEANDPFHQSARELLARGFDSEALVVFRYAGQEAGTYEPLPLGRVAGRTGREGVRHSVRSVLWQEHPGAETLEDMSLATEDGS